jgi:hypothetical protein
MGKGNLVLQYSGNDDHIIIGNPHITFFIAAKYKRHTPFSSEHIKHTLKGIPRFGETLTFDIPHIGDLIQNMYLYIELPSLENDEENYNYTESIGHAIIERIRFFIGEQIIDEFNGEYMEIYNELHNKNNMNVAMDPLIGKKGYYNEAVPNNREQKLWIPIPFWFTKKISTSLPIVALSNSSLRVELKLRSFQNIVFGTNIRACNNYDMKEITKCELIVKHYFLSTAEKRLFQSNPLDNVIIQTHTFNNQTIDNPSNITISSGDCLTQSTSRVKSNVSVPFQCILKDLYWTVNTEDNYDLNRYFQYETASGIEYFQEGRIQLDGSDIMDNLPNTFFNKIIPYEQFPSIPLNRAISVYTFSSDKSNDPEKEMQPCGHLNMFNIKNLNIQLETINTNSRQFVNIYGSAYNILHLEDGVAKLYYAYA